MPGCGHSQSFRRFQAIGSIQGVRYAVETGNIHNAIRQQSTSPRPQPSPPPPPPPPPAFVKASMFGVQLNVETIESRITVGWTTTERERRRGLASTRSPTGRKASAQRRRRRSNVSRAWSGGSRATAPNSGRVLGSPALIPHMRACQSQPVFPTAPGDKVYSRSCDALLELADMLTCSQFTLSPAVCPRPSPRPLLPCSTPPCLAYRGDDSRSTVGWTTTE
ncbi:hypothetical protein FA95DRAFT_1308955 [Auriscalpium vulgare]|uniref:Uncharacterized protein n=1 Tax=Auriscalpium vulgare TaxID=40419 RepID=A0ACB8RS91_9AGAM|nr:hypothetical protein FA95DRAFT_1308955 [Auriscalpium vulgare]